MIETSTVPAISPSSYVYELDKTSVRSSSPSITETDIITLYHSEEKGMKSNLVTEETAALSSEYREQTRSSMIEMSTLPASFPGSYEYEPDKSSPRSASRSMTETDIVTLYHSEENGMRDKVVTEETAALNSEFGEQTSTFMVAMSTLPASSPSGYVYEPDKTSPRSASSSMTETDIVTLYHSEENGMRNKVVTEETAALNSEYEEQTSSFVIEMSTLPASSPSSYVYEPDKTSPRSASPSMTETDIVTLYHSEENGMGNRLVTEERAALTSEYEDQTSTFMVEMSTLPASSPSSYIYEPDKTSSGSASPSTTENDIVTLYHSEENGMRNRLVTEERAALTSEYEGSTITIEDTAATGILAKEKITGDALDNGRQHSEDREDLLYLCNPCPISMTEITSKETVSEPASEQSGIEFNGNEYASDIIYVCNHCPIIKFDTTATSLTKIEGTEYILRNSESTSTQWHQNAYTTNNTTLYKYHQLAMLQKCVIEEDSPHETSREHPRLFLSTNNTHVPPTTIPENRTYSMYPLGREWFQTSTEALLTYVSQTTRELNSNELYEYMSSTRSVSVPLDNYIDSDQSYICSPCPRDMKEVPQEQLFKTSTENLYYNTAEAIDEQEDLQTLFEFNMQTVWPKHMPTEESKHFMTENQSSAAKIYGTKQITDSSQFQTDDRFQKELRLSLPLSTELLSESTEKYVLSTQKTTEYVSPTSSELQFHYNDADKLNIKSDYITVSSESEQVSGKIAPYSRKEQTPAKSNDDITGAHTEATVEFHKSDDEVENINLHKYYPEKVITTSEEGLEETDTDMYYSSPIVHSTRNHSEEKVTFSINERYSEVPSEYEIATTSHSLRDKIDYYETQETYNKEEEEFYKNTPVQIKNLNASETNRASQMTTEPDELMTKTNQIILTPSTNATKSGRVKEIEEISTRYIIKNISSSKLPLDSSELNYITNKMEYDKSSEEHTIYTPTFPGTMKFQEVNSFSPSQFSEVSSSHLNLVSPSLRSFVTKTVEENEMSFETESALTISTISHNTFAEIETTPETEEVPDHFPTHESPITKFSLTSERESITQLPDTTAGQLEEEEELEHTSLADTPVEIKNEASGHTEQPDYQKGGTKSYSDIQLDQEEILKLYDQHTLSRSFAVETILLKSTQELGEGVDTKQIVSDRTTSGIDATSKDVTNLEETTRLADDEISIPSLKYISLEMNSLGSLEHTSTSSDKTVTDVTELENEGSHISLTSPTVKSFATETVDENEMSFQTESFTIMEENSPISTVSHSLTFIADEHVPETEKVTNDSLTHKSPITKIASTSEREFVTSLSGTTAVQIGKEELEHITEEVNATSLAAMPAEMEIKALTHTEQTDYQKGGTKMYSDIQLDQEEILKLYDQRTTNISSTVETIYSKSTQGLDTEVDTMQIISEKTIGDIDTTGKDVDNLKETTSLADQNASIPSLKNISLEINSLRSLGYTTSELSIKLTSSSESTDKAVSDGTELNNESSHISLASPSGRFLTKTVEEDETSFQTKSYAILNESSTISPFIADEKIHEPEETTNNALTYRSTVNKFTSTSEEESVPQLLGTIAGQLGKEELEHITEKGNATSVTAAPTETEIKSPTHTGMTDYQEGATYSNIQLDQEEILKLYNQHTAETIYLKSTQGLDTEIDTRQIVSDKTISVKDTTNKDVAILKETTDLVDGNVSKSSLKYISLEINSLRSLGHTASHLSIKLRSSSENSDKSVSVGTELNNKTSHINITSTSLGHFVTKTVEEDEMSFQTNSFAILNESRTISTISRNTFITDGKIHEPEEVTNNFSTSEKEFVTQLWSTIAGQLGKEELEHITEKDNATSPVEMEMTDYQKGAAYSDIQLDQENLKIYNQQTAETIYLKSTHGLDTGVDTEQIVSDETISGIDTSSKNVANLQETTNLTDENVSISSLKNLSLEINSQQSPGHSTSKLPIEPTSSSYNSDETGTDENTFSSVRSFVTKTVEENEMSFETESFANLEENSTVATISHNTLIANEKFQETEEVTDHFLIHKSLITKIASISEIEYVTPLSDTTAGQVGKEELEHISEEGNVPSLATMPAETENETPNNTEQTDYQKGATKMYSTDQFDQEQDIFEQHTSNRSSTFETIYSKGTRGLDAGVDISGIDAASEDVAKLGKTTELASLENVSLEINSQPYLEHTSNTVSTRATSISTDDRDKTVIGGTELNNEESMEMCTLEAQSTVSGELVMSTEATESGNKTTENHLHTESHEEDNIAEFNNKSTPCEYCDEDSETSETMSAETVTSESSSVRPEQEVESATFDQNEQTDSVEMNSETNEIGDQQVTMRGTEETEESQPQSSEEETISSESSDFGEISKHLNLLESSSLGELYENTESSVVESSPFTQGESPESNSIFSSPEVTGESPSLRESAETDESFSVADTSSLHKGSSEANSTIVETEKIHITLSGSSEIEKSEITEMNVFVSSSESSESEKPQFTEESTVPLKTEIGDLEDNNTLESFSTLSVRVVDESYISSTSTEIPDNDIESSASTNQPNVSDKVTQTTETTEANTLENNGTSKSDADIFHENTHAAPEYTDEEFIGSIQEMASSFASSAADSEYASNNMEPTDLEATKIQEQALNESSKATHTISENTHLQSSELFSEEVKTQVSTGSGMSDLGTTSSMSENVELSTGVAEEDTSTEYESTTMHEKEVSSGISLDNEISSTQLEYEKSVWDQEIGTSVNVTKAPQYKPSTLSTNHMKVTNTVEIEKRPIGFETTACEYCNSLNITTHPTKTSISVGRITNNLSTIEVEKELIGFETTPCEFCHIEKLTSHAPVNKSEEGKEPQTESVRTNEETQSEETAQLEKETETVVQIQEQIHTAYTTSKKITETEQLHESSLFSENTAKEVLITEKNTEEEKVIEGSRTEIATSSQGKAGSGVTTEPTEELPKSEKQLHINNENQTEEDLQEEGRQSMSVTHTIVESENTYETKSEVEQSEEHSGKSEINKALQTNRTLMPEVKTEATHELQTKELLQTSRQLNTEEECHLDVQEQFTKEEYKTNKVTQGEEKTQREQETQTVEVTQTKLETETEEKTETERKSEKQIEEEKTEKGTEAVTGTLTQREEIENTENYSEIIENSSEALVKKTGPFHYTHGHDISLSTEGDTSPNEEQRKPVIIIVNNSKGKHQKLNKSFLEYIISTSVPDVELQYVDLNFDNDQNLQPLWQNHTAETNKSYSVCNKTDFESRKNCFCYIQGYLDTLKNRITNNKSVDSTENYCLSYVKLKNGLQIHKPIKPGKRKRRGLIYMDSIKQKGDYLQYDSNENIFDGDFQLTLTDKTLFHLPGETVEIPCTSLPENVIHEGEEMVWMFYPLSSTEGELLPEKGQELLLHEISVKNSGNYTCSPENKKGIRVNQSWHELELITFPIYHIVMNIFYEVNESCNLQNGDILHAYLPKVANPILCTDRNELCSVQMERPRCLTREDNNYFNVTMTAKMNSNFVLRFHDQCDINCKLRMYENMVNIIYTNSEIFERIPVYSHLEETHDVDFIPHLDGKEGSPVIVKPPKIIVSCPDGFGLESRKQRVCVVCPAQTFSNEDEAFCRKCAGGQYQPKPGSKSCLQCNSPVDDKMCLRMLYSDTKLFKIYVGVAFGAIVLMVIIIVVWTSGINDDRVTGNRYYEGSLRHRAAISRKDADLEIGANEPLLRQSPKRIPPQLPPVDF